LNLDDLQSLMNLVSVKNVKYADIRYEHVFTTSISIKRTRNNRTEAIIIPSTTKGISTRILVENSWGFSHTSLTDKKDIEKSIQESIKIAKATSKYKKEKIELSDAKRVQGKYALNVKKEFSNIPINEKIELLRKTTELAFETSKNVIKVEIDYEDNVKRKLLVSTDGVKAEMQRSEYTIRIKTIAKEDEKITETIKRIGGVGGWEKITFKELEEKTIEGAKEAENLLKAKKKPPSGKTTVILSPQIAGTLIHEALGHAMEGDIVAAGFSILANKINSKVGSELVTIVDDPTIEAYGLYWFDDDGTPAQKTILVEKGILKTFMHNRETAWKLKAQPTSNSYAVSYEYLPIVRQTNIMLMPGDWTLEEMIEDIKSGLLIGSSSGGTAATSIGTFQFGFQYAHLIKNGEIKEVTKGSSIAGSMFDALKNVDALGKKVEIIPGACGKDGQYMNQGRIMPYVRLKEILIGG